MNNLKRFTLAFLGYGLMFILFFWILLECS